MVVLVHLSLRLTLRRRCFGTYLLRVGRSLMVQPVLAGKLRTGESVGSIEWSHEVGRVGVFSRPRNRSSSD